ncbi:MAG: immunoglobulin domain-containing protein, partial [Acidobacteriota bacterium]|nr:immunoglobulin domain-containing protein [Acidobacteriota bacterium]
GGVSITPSTWLQLRHSASPATVCVGDTSTLSADILGRNAGSALTTELNGLPTFDATFTNHTPALGTVSGDTDFVNGQASATFTATANGSASIGATADNETVDATVIVEANTTTNPGNQAVCEGGTATFSTTASGPGPITFVWKKGATVLNNGDLGGRVSGADTNSLVISNVQASDADTYTVEATGSCGTASQSATLTVNDATTATDPADATVCQGASASFSTTAGGTSPFTYAWTVDGSPAGTTSSINVATGSLSVGNHSVEVTVSGACGNAMQSATLTVQEGTSTTDPADATVCQGATASFSTTASGTGPFTYAWTVDGSPAGTTSSIDVATGSLSVGNHAVEVTVSGSCGSAVQSATLTVQESTSTTDPADATVCQGATASFSTTASGTGPFTYAWTVDGSPAGSSSSINVATGSLSVGNHTVAVTVSGTCGTASQTATLTVQETTSTTDPADVTVCPGGMANFSTTASGTGPFHYAWTVDGLPYNGDSPSISVNTTGMSLGAHTVSVTVTGTCGSATQSATLTIADSAGPTITLHTQSISLWPPNHDYHTFTISQFVASASDACDGTVDISDVRILQVTSDEPEENPNGADGNTLDDIVIAPGCTSVQLRSERDGNLNGRVYTITFIVFDSNGNSSTATATVTVPKTQFGAPATDDGPQYTETCP